MTSIRGKLDYLSPLSNSYSGVDLLRPVRVLRHPQTSTKTLFLYRYIYTVYSNNKPTTHNTKVPSSASGERHIYGPKIIGLTLVSIYFLKLNLVKHC